MHCTAGQVLNLSVLSFQVQDPVAVAFSHIVKNTRGIMSLSCARHTAIGFLCVLFPVAQLLVLECLLPPRVENPYLSPLAG